MLNAGKRGTKIRKQKLLYTCGTQGNQTNGQNRMKKTMNIAKEYKHYLTQFVRLVFPFKARGEHDRAL